jgi:hypothetical protein
MKYQSQHDLIDPEVPPPETDAEPEGKQDPGADDAYVIGEQANTVRVLDVTSPRKSKRRSKAWVRPLGVALGAVFVGMTVWNLSRLLGGPPPLPTPSPFQVKQALYLGVMKIDAYRRVHGVAPGSLAEAGLPEEGGYTYRRMDPLHYLVSFQGNGPKLEYDSSISKDRFFGSPQDILSMGGSK